MNKNFLISISLTFALCNFISFPAMTQGFEIKGRITDLKDGAVVKLSNFDLRLVMDSCTVKDGQFYFKGQVDQPHKAIMRVYMPDSTWVVSYNSFYLDNAEYQVYLEHLESFKQTYLTTNKGANQDYNKLMKMTEDVRRRRDELTNRTYTNNVEYDYEIVRSLQSNMETIEKKYLRENTNTFPALDLMISFARPIQYQKKDPTRELIMSLDSLKYYYNQLDRKLKKTLKAEAIFTSLYGDKVTGEGQPYIELEATVTLDEQPFKIMDVNTEYILLDFTGVHCGWCKKFDAKILPDYDKIRDKIEIVSFYTDTNIEWVRDDVKKHDIPWTVVSDFKGDYSPNTRRYQIQGIPDFFLLDKDRNIIRHQVGYNEGFIQYLVALGTSIQNE